MADIKSERLQLEALENLFKQKRFSEALNFSKKLTRDYPHSFPIKFIHVRTLKELNRLGEAVEALNEMMLTFPNNINLLSEGGILAIKRTRFDEALEYYNRILFLDPFNAEAKDSIDRIQTIKNSGVVSGAATKKMDFISYQSEQFNRSDTLHEFDTSDVRRAASAPKTTPPPVQEPEPVAPPPEPLDTLDIFDTPESELPPPLSFDEIQATEELPPLNWDLPEEEATETAESIPTDIPETFTVEPTQWAEETTPPTFELEGFADSPLTEEIESLNVEPIDQPEVFPTQPPLEQPSLAWDEQEIAQKEEPELFFMPTEGENEGEDEGEGEDEVKDFASLYPEEEPVEASQDASLLAASVPGEEFLEAAEAEPMPLPDEFAFAADSSLLPPPPAVEPSDWDAAEQPDEYEATMISEEPVALDGEEYAEAWPTDTFQESETVDTSPYVTTAEEEEVPSLWEDTPTPVETFQEPVVEQAEEDAEIITESAAELYLKQGLLDDAIMIYTKLYHQRQEERFLVKLQQVQTIRTNQKKIDVLNAFLKVLQTRH